MLRDIFTVVILSACVCTLCSAYCDYESGNSDQYYYCYDYAYSVNVFAVITGSTIAFLIGVTVIALIVTLVCCVCLKHKGYTVVYTSVPTAVSMQRHTETQIRGPSGVTPNGNRIHVAASATVPMPNEQASRVQQTGLPNFNMMERPAASSSTTHQNIELLSNYNVSGPSRTSPHVNQGHLAGSTTVPMTNEQQATGVQPTGLPNSNTGGPPAASTSAVYQNMGFFPH